VGWTNVEKGRKTGIEIGRKERSAGFQLVGDEIAGAYEPVWLPRGGAGAEQRGLLARGQWWKCGRALSWCLRGWLLDGSSREDASWCRENDGLVGSVWAQLPGA